MAVHMELERLKVIIEEKNREIELLKKVFVKHNHINL